MIRMPRSIRGSGTTTGISGRMHTGTGRSAPRGPACHLGDTVPAPPEPVPQ
jgi:hypothetical protein